jgi:hypothetical protein
MPDIYCRILSRRCRNGVVSLLWAKKQNDLSALSQRAAHYCPIASAITCIFAAIAVMILSDD